MENLKPCPFCGKTDTLEILSAKSCEECINFEDELICPAFEPYHDDMSDICPQKIIVCCFGKGGCGASSGYYTSEDEAIAAWNRRAHDAADNV